jgi:hypothetical protein
MNYTHYWYYPVIADMTEINNVINEVKKLEKILNLVMRYNNSDGIIDNKNIYFNKIDGEDIFNGAFMIDFTKINKNNQYSYCKTNRNPKFDMMVSLILLSMVNNIKDFYFSSDGDNEDWIQAIKIYKEYIGELDNAYGKFLFNTLHNISVLFIKKK